MTSFRGGIHPEYNKITASLKTEAAKLPKKVIIPLQQHIGAPCEALVNVGDYVKAGQKIGEAKGFVSAPVHASISGNVRDINPYAHPLGMNINSIVIEAGETQESVDFEKIGNVDDLDNKAILNKIKEAGVVGMGGAAFPTHVKLSPPPEKPIDTVILNGAECEPYLTCDHRLMLEETEKILKGFELIIRVTKAKNAYIGIEDNKENAILFFQDKLSGNNKYKIKIIKLKTKYPQGAEKQLIYAVTNRKVPVGGLPMDVGCVVDNVGTAKAIFDSVYEGEPLIERTLTITGAVNEPKNLLVKIGTPFKDVIENAKGLKGEPKKIIMGGPMMGLAQSSDEVPVIKGTSGILVLDENEAKHFEEHDCIKCAKCVDVCTMNLMPNLIAKNVQYKRFKVAEKLFVMDCFECGCCTYTCPSKIPIVHYIKYAKNEILKNKKK